MRVLITGGAGFIGHHVVEHLLKNTDWEIVSLDRLSVSGCYRRFTEMEIWAEQGKRVHSIPHCLRSPINSIVKAEIGRIDYILHLAASTHVDRSIQDPMGFVLDNVVATTNLLMYANDSAPRQVVYFSTDEVFGPAPEGTAYKEWDRYNSGNPYSAAKAGGEEMALAFSNTYGLPVMITHTMNVFGERQHAEKFIPKVISSVLSGKVVSIHSNKARTKAGSRFYIHGRNVGDALLFLLMNYEGTDKFNIVGEKEVDNLELAQAIASFIPDAELKYELVDFHSSRPGHDLRYALDGGKMKQLGWQPPKDFEASLEKTVHWYLEHRNWLAA